MGFHIGPLTIRYYGLILMTGALAAAWLSYRRAKQMKRNPEIVWDGLVWVLIGGIVGARLWHIFTPPPSMVAQGITVAYYLSHPLDAIAIWKGGLGIPGAVIGGAIAMFFLTRSRNESFAVWADIVAPGVALGQAIGRWGNYVNQELYGAPTSLPWGIHIDPAYRLPEYMNQTTYHPLFLYESLWNLGNMFLLLWIGQRFARKLIKGDLFLVYLIVYPIGRFLLEFIRLDSSQVGGINANQTFVAVVGLVSLIALLLRHKMKIADHAPSKKRK